MKQNHPLVHLSALVLIAGVILAGVHSRATFINLLKSSPVEARPFTQAVYDLSVTNSPSYDRAVAGGRVYWLVTVNNSGAESVSEVRLKFTLPAKTTFAGCIPELGSCGGDGANRTISVPSLEAGQTISALFTATVDNSVMPGEKLVSNAVVEPTTNDSNQNNNAAMAMVTVTQANAFLRGKTNGKIVISTGGDAISINPDGSGSMTLPGVRLQPVWSPDGTKLAYLETVQFPADNVIYVIDADGSNRVRVATNPVTGDFARFSWSPDGTKIVYGGTFQRFLYIANADGSGQFRLPFGPSDAEAPDWSPDGARIAYAKFGEIWVTDIDGINQKRIVPRTNLNDFFYRPQWSPDGSKLLFTRATSSSRHAMLVNADGTGLTRAFNLLGSSNPCWSPDGTKVVLEKFDSITVINYDGSNPLSVTRISFSSNSTLHWQPLPSNIQPQPPPEAPTFSIAGKITLRDGSPFTAGAIVRISGDAEGEGPSDDNTVGAYRFVRLRQGGDYTIIPDNLAFTYEPPSRAINDLNADVAGADFIATYRPFRVSGRVTDSAGAGIGGVRMLLSSLQTETNADGFYSFDNVTGGSDFTIFPFGSSQSGETYEPREVRITRLAEDKTVNFTGVRGKYEIFGAVSDSLGGLVSGATVTLSGAANASTTTDSEGKYSFKDLTSGFVYSLKAEKQGLMIAPASRAVILNSSLQVSFIANAGQISAVSAASFRPQDVVSLGIVSLFGSGLAESAKLGEGLPFEIDGVSVTLATRDFNTYRASLFFVSPQQINFLMPFPKLL